MDYITLIHNNTKTPTSEQQWQDFFTLARNSGLFDGGSAIGERFTIGDSQDALSSDHIVGYMRFSTEDRDALETLLQQHPVILNGGSVELCECPRT